MSMYLYTNLYICVAVWLKDLHGPVCSRQVTAALGPVVKYQKNSTFFIFLYFLIFHYWAQGWGPVVKYQKI